MRRDSCCSCVGHTVSSVGRPRLPTLSAIAAGVRYAARLVVSGEAFPSSEWEERIEHFHEDELIRLEKATERIVWVKLRPGGWVR